MWVRAANLEGRKAKATASKAYKTWTRVRKRCYSVTDKDFRYYGGRGIAMCEEWREDFPTFRQWAISTGIGRDMTIDRINNDGPYCPGNCQWVPQSEQSKNRSMSKVTEADVLHIRSTNMPARMIMRRYGLSSGHTYKILRGERWPHIKPQ